MIVIGLWQTADPYKAHTHLHRKLCDLETILCNQFHSRTIIDPSPDGILQRALDSGATHCVVMQSGVYSLDYARLGAALERFCATEFVLAGHLMWHHRDPHPWLHPQCFIVNLPAWRDMGKPSLSFPVGLREAIVPQRSQENVHDDYTPLWLDSGPERQALMLGSNFGENLLQVAIESKGRVINLPQSIRQDKFFIYPDCTTKAFNKELARLHKGAGRGTNEVVHAQDAFLKRRRRRDKHGVLYIFNTEPITARCDESQFDRLMVLAAGFKPFLLWVRYGAPSGEIIFYDKFQRNLDHWSQMLLDWDGTDLKRYLLEVYPDLWGAKSIRLDSDRAIPSEKACETGITELLSQFENEETFRAKWMEFRQLKHRFIRLDLLERPMEVARFAKSRRTLLWTSNVFDFSHALLLRGPVVMEDAFAQMMAALKDEAPDTFLIGKRPGPVTPASWLAITARKYS